jgi:hypothetical protein
MLVQDLTDPAHLDRAVEADEGSAEPMITMVELLGTARTAGMNDDDVAVVVALLNASTVKQAAMALGVTDRTVRNRRQGVVRQLRALADVA